MRKDEFPIVDKFVKDSINEVLDKIRAEIDQYLEIEGFGSEYRNDVKGIIDKYTAESEETETNSTFCG